MVLIHIGHHKCASSFLQYEVFPKIKDVKLLAYEEKSIGILKLQKEMTDLIYTPNIFYDHEKNSQIFKNQDINCISYEGLIGHGVNSGTGMQIEYIAKRLKNIYPDAKILLVIRNQVSFIESWYKDNVKFGYVAGFEKWFKRKKIHNELNWIKYGEIVKLYQELFSKDNVKVVLFEELFSKNKITEILEFANMKNEGLENVNLNKKLNGGQLALTLPLTRLINKSFGSKVNYGNGFVYTNWRKYGIPLFNSLSLLLKFKKTKLGFDGYKREIYELYHKSNKLLNSITGIDLKKHNYP